MKRHVAFLAFVCLGITLFQSCSDQHMRTFTANVPVYMSYEELRHDIAPSEARPLEDPGKIYFKDNYLLINELNDGIHIIDNTNPRDPQNIAFIDIPGNIDMAVRGKYLYADSYVDLVIFNLENPRDVKFVKRVEDYFSYYYPPSDPEYPSDEIDPSKGVITGWQIEKITREEEHYPFYPYPILYAERTTASPAWNMSSSGKVNSSSGGTGGSMARFIIYHDYMYMLDDYDLKIMNLADPENPEEFASKPVGNLMETVFIEGNYLYMGARNGMFIYDLSNPSGPVQTGSYMHVTSCDPVVVENDYAYVTLRSGNFCGQSESRLDVIDVSNKTQPVLEVSYTMTEPYGLGIDNGILFVCEGDKGLKVYDAGDLQNITGNLLAGFPAIHAWDVIPTGNILFVIGKDGLYQYSYEDVKNIEEISRILVSNNQ